MISPTSLGMLSPASSTFSIEQQHPVVSFPPLQQPNALRVKAFETAYSLSSHLSMPSGSLLPPSSFREQQQPYGRSNGYYVLPSPSPSPNINPRTTTPTYVGRTFSNNLLQPSFYAPFGYKLPTKAAPLGQHQMAISSPRIMNVFQTVDSRNTLQDIERRKSYLCGSTLSIGVESQSNGSASRGYSYKHYDSPIFSSINGLTDTIRHIDALVQSATNDLIELQSVEAMDWLNGIAVTRLTNLFELYSSSATISPKSKQIRFVKRLRNFVVQVKDKTQNNGNENCPPTEQSNLWGMPLSKVQSKTVDSSPLPRFVHDIIDYLEKNACSAEGIFRKSGVKPRIVEIKERCSKLDPSSQIPGDLLTESQFYDVADALKQYFRELPECLMTNRVSEVLENCVVELPENKHFAALHFCILFMPSENREALLILLRFLNKIASCSESNQMTAQNLSTCLMPTLFQLNTHSTLTATSNLARNHLRRRNTIGMPNQREMRVFLAIKQVLASMITNSESLSRLPSSVSKELQARRPHGIRELEMPFRNEQFLFTEEILQRFKRQHRVLLEMYNDCWKDWDLMRVFPDGTHLYTRFVKDFSPLKMFRIELDIDAPVNLIQASILHNRHMWDTNVVDCRKVRSNCGQNYDVVRLTYCSPNSRIEKTVFIARRWSYGGVGEPVTTIERSIVPPRTCFGSERLAVYKSSFLIVPRAPGQSRLIYLARIDLRGRNSSWYDRVYGEILANQFVRFRQQLCCNFRGTLV